MLALCLCATALAQVEDTTSGSTRPETRSEAKSKKSKKGYAKKHCGLYCVYTLLRIGGKPVDFRDLVKPEYLGSRDGSSLAELKRAALDHGLYAEAVGNLSTSDLVDLPYPVILHMKASAASKKHDHYRLLLATEDGKAKLFDPPDPVTLVPFSELAPLWAGAGLVVSDKPIDTGALLAPARKRFALYAAAAVGLILLMRWAARRWQGQFQLRARRARFGLAAAQGAALVVLAVLTGFTYHFISDWGFLSQGGATDSVEHAHAETFAPKLAAEDVRTLMDADAVIVDARLARDYESGHMEGALSVPVDATETQRHAAMADVPQDAAIVIYCQSAGCPFAGKVATKLRSDGYANISIYRGGWNDWVAKNGKDKEVSS